MAIGNRSTKISRCHHRRRHHHCYWLSGSSLFSSSSSSPCLSYIYHQEEVCFRPHARTPVTTCHVQKGMAMDGPTFAQKSHRVFFSCFFSSLHHLLKPKTTPPGKLRESPPVVGSFSSPFIRRNWGAVLSRWEARGKMPWSFIWAWAQTPSPATWPSVPVAGLVNGNMPCHMDACIIWWWMREPTNVDWNWLKHLGLF